MASTLLATGNQTSNVVEVPSAARTVSGNSGTLTGYGAATSLIVQQSVTVIAGTSPTLDMVVEDTLDGTNFFTIATFAQVLAVTGNAVQPITGVFTDQIRIRWTIGGTTPSYTFSVQIFAKGTNALSRIGLTS